MKRNEIISQLRANHSDFTHFISTLSEAQFTHADADKWSAGQQLDHLVRSVKPLAQVLMLPKFVPRLLFGKIKRTSRSYDEQVAHYQGKLAKGGKASGKYVPQAVAFAQRKALVAQLDAHIASLCKSLASFSEDELNNMLLPHPLLGKLTLREMMYFSIYHVKHHHEGIKKAIG
jgi:hypothetical protein